jgi:two-component system, response regulator RegA
MTEAPAVSRILVVEDDLELAQVLVELCGRWGGEVRCAGSLVEAEEVLATWNPGLVVLDVDLPDGRADELVELLHRVPPVPPIVAMSAVAGPQVAFHLGELGVRAYLEKPFTLEAFGDAVGHALTVPPDPRPALRASIGHQSLKEIESDVRRTLVDEALRRSGGSRRGAGRLLGVSRQFIQQTLRRLSEDP